MPPLIQCSLGVQNQGFFMGIEYVQNGSRMNLDGASTKLM